MKFSVITPLFNGMPEVKKCIGSVKSQASNSISIEHFIQDGGSNDNSLQFLETYTNDQLNTTNDDGKYYNFNFQSSKDKGMYDAINKGWSRSTGDIYSWLNHDEQYLPGTLTIVDRFFQNNPDVDVVYGNMIVVDKDGNPLSARREIPIRENYVKHNFLYAISCTIFFRSSLFHEGILKFNDNLICAGDLELMLKLINYGKKIVHIDKYFSLFGVDGSNLSVKKSDILNSEIKKIQSSYGASNNKIVRFFYKSLRCIERILKGCYKTDSIIFKYVLNENSDFVIRSCTDISSRFTYDHVNKIMNRNKL